MLHALSPATHDAPGGLHKLAHPSSEITKWRLIPKFIICIINDNPNLNFMRASQIQNSQSHSASPHSSSVALVEALSSRKVVINARRPLAPLHTVDMDRSGSSSEDRPRSSDSSFGPPGPFEESALQNLSNLSLGKATQWNAERSALDPEDPEKLGALGEEDLEILEATHDAELVALRAAHDVEPVCIINTLEEEKVRDSKMNRLSGRPIGGFNPTNTEDLKALKEALDSKETIPKTEIKSDRRPRDPLVNTESRRLRVVSSPRHDVEIKSIKSIVRRPREMFPDEPTPTREGVALVKDAKKDRIPPDARWTKISRNLVSPEALESGKERFEAREDFVIVLRVLSGDEVQGYAKVTERIRAARQEQEDIEAAERRRARRGRHERHKSGKAQRDQPTPLNPTLAKTEERRIKRENDTDTDSGDSDIGASNVVITSSRNSRITSNNSNSSIGQGSSSLGSSQPQRLLPKNNSATASLPVNIGNFEQPHNQARASLPVNVGDYKEPHHYVAPSHRREVIPSQTRSGPSAGSIITTNYKVTAEPPPSQRNSIREVSQRRSSLDDHNRPIQVTDDKARHITIDNHNRPIVITPSRPVSYARPVIPLRYPYSSNNEDYFSTPASSSNGRLEKRHSVTMDNSDMNRLSNEGAGGSRLKLERERGYTRYAGSVVRHEDTVVDDYGDNGYGYTNPRDLVQYDLNRPTKIPSYNDRIQQDLIRGSRPSSMSGYDNRVVVREDLANRPNSISGYNDHVPRSYDRRERGPPPTTRGFDKIPRSYDNRERGPPPSTRGFDKILERGTWEQPQPIEPIQSPAHFKPISAPRRDISHVRPAEEQPQVGQVRMPDFEEAQTTIPGMAPQMKAAADMQEQIDDSDDAKLFPKPHICAKGKNCSKWKKQLGPVEQWKHDHPNMYEAVPVTLWGAGDQGNPIAAEPITKFTRPVSEVSHRPKKIIDLGGPAEGHQGVASIDTPPPEKPLSKITTKSNTTTAASLGDTLFTATSMSFAVAQQQRLQNAENYVAIAPAMENLLDTADRAQQRVADGVLDLAGFKVAFEEQQRIIDSNALSPGNLNPEIVASSKAPTTAVQQILPDLETPRSSAVLPPETVGGELELLNRVGEEMAQRQSDLNLNTPNICEYGGTRSRWSETLSKRQSNTTYIGSVNKVSFENEENENENEEEEEEKEKNRSEKEDDAKSETSVRSGVSSIASITESIFSIATGSSMSSIASPQSAVERLVSLLLNDSDIKSLCTFFLLNNDDRERLERNLRRLLKEFAVGLRQEAASAQQRHAAHFVRLRARNSAHMICSSLSKKKKTVELKEVGVEYMSEESESDSSDDEVDDLQGLETFVKTSKAFETLRENLKNFVHHGRVASNLERQKGDVKQVSQAPTTEHQVGTPGKERNEVRDMAVLLAARMECDGSGSLEPEKVLENEQKLTDAPKVCSRKGLNKYAFQHDTFGLLAWFSTIGRLGTLLNMTPSAVPTGKTRIKWKCKCGHTITDDFTELRPGAAARWKGTLSHSADRSNSSKSSTISGLSRRFSSGFSTLQSLVSSQGTKDLESDLPTHELGPVRNPTENARYQAETPASPDRQLIYLLVCYNEGRHATRLLQLDLSTLQTLSDKALFQILRRQYHELRASWISFMSLRTLESIRFVHFEMYPRELIDVRKQDDVPPPEDIEYRYTPAPPDILPPVGSNYLMHVFQHPDCAELEPLCLSRFPKKLKEKLRCRGGIKPGWGLHFVEGWTAKRIWIVVFIIFGLGSLTTGILWAVFKHSIQDAFALASYMVAFATVSVGTVQALVVM